MSLSASPYPRAAHIFQQISLLDSAALLLFPCPSMQIPAGLGTHYPRQAGGTRGLSQERGHSSRAEAVRVKLMDLCKCQCKAVHYLDPKQILDSFSLSL